MSVLDLTVDRRLVDRKGSWAPLGHGRETEAQGRAGASQVNGRTRLKLQWLRLLPTPTPPPSSGEEPPQPGAEAQAGARSGCSACTVWGAVQAAWGRGHGETREGDPVPAQPTTPRCVTLGKSQCPPISFVKGSRSSCFRVKSRHRACPPPPPAHPTASCEAGETNSAQIVRPEEAELNTRAGPVGTVARSNRILGSK